VEKARRQSAGILARMKKLFVAITLTVLQLALLRASLPTGRPGASSMEGAAAR